MKRVNFGAFETLGLVFRVLRALLQHLQTSGFRTFVRQIHRRAFLARVARARRAAGSVRDGADGLRSDDGYRRD
ncbi:MAG: hypothetical protein AAFU56_02465 [Pseudomonadota bacterium]